jgi:hypothetical protein
MDLGLLELGVVQHWLTDGFGWAGLAGWLLCCLSFLLFFLSLYGRLRSTITLGRTSQLGALEWQTALYFLVTGLGWRGESLLGFPPALAARPSFRSASKVVRLLTVSLARQAETGSTIES